VNLKLPPLRERPADILALAEHFAKKYAAANGVESKPIAASTKLRLRQHSWPGNVRELENAMHRAVLLSIGPEIEETAIRLPDGQPLQALASDAAAEAVTRAAMATGQAVADLSARGLVGQTVAQVEQQLIIDTLQHCLGNRTHAANILGISIRTLRNKLKEYSEAGVSVPAPQGPGVYAA